MKPLHSKTKQGDLFPISLIQQNPVEYNSIRNAVRFYSTKCFTIPQHEVALYYDQYFLLYWRGDHFMQCTARTDGLLLYGDTTYAIHYKVGMNRGYILHHSTEQFALSFRKPYNQLDLPAIVMVDKTVRRIK